MSSCSDPRQRFEYQALHCRAAWQKMAESYRQRVLGRLTSEGGLMMEAWIAGLERRHSLSEWLDGDYPFSLLPTEFPTGPSPRQLVSSHPFSDFHPWLNLPISPESS